MEIINSGVSNSFSFKENQIHDLTRDKITEMVKKRLSDISEELNRLIESRAIQQSIKNITVHYPQLTDGQKVAIAQTFELQTCLEDTHYVLNHGQSSGNFLLNVTVKKIKELIESKKYTYFTPLRHEIFLENFSKERDVLWYRKELSKNGTSDAQYRAELLSCDINLESTDLYESALFFFLDNSNMALRLAETLIPDVIKNYISDDVVSSKIANEILDLSKDMSGGVLHSICIPKDRFSDIGYLSNFGGSPVFPFTNLHNIFTVVVQAEKSPLLSLIDRVDSWLDYFQITTWLDHYQLSAQRVEMDKAQNERDVYQVRLLTSQLTPENNIFILSHSAASEELLRIESAVEEILLRNIGTGS